MWNSIRRFWERWLLAVFAVFVAAGIIWWDLHSTIWGWLGETNGGETNSATFRNFGLFPVSLLAIWLTWRRIRIAAHESQTSRRNLQTAQDALNLNYKTLDYNAKRDEMERRLNQYARASERVSGDSISARLGAIYELRDLTEQHLEQFHVRTMRMLCAFVRFPPNATDAETLSDEERCDRPLRPDVQAAMEVIGGRTEKHINLESDDGYTPDLRSANLVRLELWNSNLSKINFGGSRFWGAAFVRVDLSGSLLAQSDFRSPWVVKDQERPQFANQQGGTLAMSNTYLNEFTQILATDLSDAKLPLANLRGSLLDRSNLSNSDLAESNLADAVLQRANLTGTNLYDAELTGADMGSAATGPVEGLTQAQLDRACADPDNPPKLGESSGLVWNERECLT